MKVGINESQAIGVDAVGGTHLADDADCRFAIAIRTTKDELLLGGKFVMRNDASAVEAEENGIGGLGENLAVEIAADQEDGNFFRNAAERPERREKRTNSVPNGPRDGWFVNLLPRSGQAGDLCNPRRGGERSRLEWLDSNETQARRKRGTMQHAPTKLEKDENATGYRCDDVAAEAEAVLPMASPFTTSSTRRLRWRPSPVSFEATGCVLPKPRAVMDEAGTPCSARKSRTESARRSESC